MNDTIKAVRQHRAHSLAVSDGPEASDPIAEQVMTRLQRLAAASPQVSPASVEVVEASEDIETGS